MALDLNGWDMHDIGVAMKGKSFFEILSLYKDKEKQLSTKGVEYLQAFKDKNDTAKDRIEKEFDHLEKEKCVIALHIAEVVTKEGK